MFTSDRDRSQVASATSGDRRSTPDPEHRDPENLPPERMDFDEARTRDVIVSAIAMAVLIGMVATLL